MNHIAEKSQAAQTVKDFAQRQHERALQRYNEHFNNTLYQHAKLNRWGTGELSIARANLLIDDALALCGSPFYSMSKTRWAEDALVFFAQFTKEER